MESFVLLSALGGDCIEDMERLRQDKGLAAMLGYCPPPPETARQWLDKFHDDELTIAQPRQRSFIVPESAALAGLKEPNLKPQIRLDFKLLSQSFSNSSDFSLPFR